MPKLRFEAPRRSLALGWAGGSRRSQRWRVLTQSCPIGRGEGLAGWLQPTRKGSVSDLETRRRCLRALSDELNRRTVIEPAVSDEQAWNNMLELARHRWMTTAAMRLSSVGTRFTSTATATAMATRKSAATSSGQPWPGFTATSRMPRTWRRTRTTGGRDSARRRSSRSWTWKRARPGSRSGR